MTSGKLYFKLLKQDIQRRLWAVSLIFLAFFFTLPVGLALNMEDASRTNYSRYNDYEPFVREMGITEGQYEAAVLEFKTKVVADQAQYGNGLIICLVIAAAVVLGVSGFSYLHNKRKVDFYHSLPIRREMLFTVQYVSGILIVAAAYAVNLLFFTGVAMANGVSPTRFLGLMAAGFGLNLLYYCLLYSVVIAAMMITGNMVVGMLGTGVFFFFLPFAFFVIIGYCQTFFVTEAGIFGDMSTWGMKYLSPFGAYLFSVEWKGKLISHIPSILCTLFAFLAITMLDLQMYRMRPSEAAGKAIAFSRIKAPLRILMVLGFGASGGLFFWMLQSSLAWGVFGVIAAVVLSHCVIEVIYHFDFKKLLSHKVQLVFCLGVNVLLLLSFRYDWYGYDSYLPSREKLASATIGIGEDNDFLTGPYIEVREDGRLMKRYGNSMEQLKERMDLTDVEPVLVIAEEGRREIQENRDERLGIRPRITTFAAGQEIMAITENKDASAVSVIGGADGPTSVFVAAKVGNSPEEEPDYESYVQVCWHLTDGRRVSRRYRMKLGAVMEAYQALYENEEYKTGIYPILDRKPEDVAQVIYEEGKDIFRIQPDSGVRGELLKAYQEDLRNITLDQRKNGTIVGSITFMSSMEEQYVKQEYEEGRVTESFGAVPYVSEDTHYYREISLNWPVYDSFAETLSLLRKQDIPAGELLLPEQVKQIRVDMGSILYWKDQPRSEEGISQLRSINPRIDEKGILVFDQPEEIRELMTAIMDEQFYVMDFLYHSGDSMACQIQIDGAAVDGRLIRERITPQIVSLFGGIL